MNTRLIFLAVMAACGTGLATAGDVTGLVTFQSGTKALAAEVNGNFTAVKTAVDDNDSRVTTNTAGIATNTAGNATNAADVATNAADVATNAADVATNAAGIATNTTGIATNTAGIATNATGIATNATGIATNTADVATNTAGIATNAAGIATNTADIATNAADIAALQAGTRPEHVAYVSPSGADYVDPVAAMADLATWCGTPSATNLCLLKIMPGAYVLPGQFVMQPFVDVEGSGEAVTRLTGAVSGPIGTGGVVTGANDAELRNLTVESKGSGGQGGAGIAIRATNITSTFSVRQVTALASGFFNNVGVYTASANATLKDVTARSTGGTSATAIWHAPGVGTPTVTHCTAVAGSASVENSGILLNSSRPVIRSSLVQASGTGAIGIRINAAGAGDDPVIKHTRVESTGASIGEGPSAHSSIVRVSHSVLDGPFSVASGGPHVCVFVADGALTEYGTSCP